MSAAWRRAQRERQERYRRIVACIPKGTPRPAPHGSIEWVSLPEAECRHIWTEATKESERRQELTTLRRRADEASPDFGR